MTVYQCLRCRKIYGYDSRVKKLDTFDPKTHTRFLDCDTCRCPKCNIIQDTRDIQSFLGTEGGGNLKQLSELEIQAYFLGNVEAIFELSQLEDYWDGRLY